MKRENSLEGFYWNADQFGVRVDLIRLFERVWVRGFEGVFGSGK